MAGLRELQAVVGRAVLGHDEPSLGDVIQATGSASAARLQIYRHHYESSLAEALKAIYPVVCRLVDERFFAFAAHEYIKSSPPRRVCLHEYGADFAEFLASFPPCRELVYLPDVARLEQQINVSLHSPAEEALGTEAFLDRGAGRLSAPGLPAAALAPLSRIPLARRSHLARPAGRAGGRRRSRRRRLPAGDPPARRGGRLLPPRCARNSFSAARFWPARRWKARLRPPWPPIRCSIWRWRSAGSWPKGSSPAFPSLPPIPKPRIRRCLP